ncbi:hypothetical protein ACFSJY_12425 [Thalassotalea euphylliae]|uniref:hypothetical protein n=1 Tax=Thalassotalea euphylliae TaxID=1655234 RepID=UPI00362EA65A
MRFTLLASTLLLTFIWNSAFALPLNGEGKRQKMEQKIEQTAEQLGLTDEQKDAIKPLLEDAKNKRKATMAEFGLERGKGRKNLSKEDRKALKAKMKEIDESLNASLANHLSSEQLAEYKALKQQARDQKHAFKREKREQHN